MGAITLVPILVVLAAASASESPLQRQNRTVQALYVTSPPVIDGLLDEPAWSETGRANAFRDKEGTLTRARTYVRFLCDDENLYIGALCSDHQIEYLRARATSENLEGFWQDDLLVFRFDIQNRPASDTPYAQIAINASGTIQIENAQIEHPERLCTTAVSRTTSGFVTEVSMPLRVFGVEKLNIRATWGLNIRRARARGRADGGEDVFWCNPHLSFDNPSYFGGLIVGPTSEFYVWRLNLACQGMGQNNPATIGVRGATDKEVTAGFTAFVGNITPPAPATRTIRPRRASLIRAYYDVADPEPTQTLTAELTRGATGEVLYRLAVPITVPPPLEIDFRSPHYDGLLFPDARLLRAVVRLNAPAEDPRQFVMKSEMISAATTNPIQLTDRSIQPGVNGIVHRSKYIPAGPAELRVEISADGAPYARVFVDIVKLTTQEVAALPVYVDRRKRMIVNGEPFFPIGWYGSGSLEHLKELADSPFNCVLDYGMNAKSPREVQAYLDAAEAQGMKVIYCMSDVYPGAAYRTKMGDWEGNEKIAHNVVTTWKNHPALIAWYLNDELPVAKVPEMRSYYRMFRRLDRGHPTLLVHRDEKALRPFRNTVDMIGVHRFPIPGDPEDVGGIIDAAKKAVTNRKPVWAVVQAFGWYQYRPAEDPNATGDRGRTPTTLELATGRAPNREEIRCMTYLALVRGAMGILYHSYHDMRVLPQYDAMWRWMKQIGEELRSLSPFLLEGFRRPLFFRKEAEGVSGISIVLGDEACILVVNSSRKLQEVSFRLPPGTWVKAKSLFAAYDRFELQQYTINDKIAPLVARAYRLLSPAAVAAEAEVSAASDVAGASEMPTATEEVQELKQETAP